jgi:hypothetical protein
MEGEDNFTSMERRKLSEDVRERKCTGGSVTEYPVLERRVCGEVERKSGE